MMSSDSFKKSAVAMASLHTGSRPPQTVPLGSSPAPHRSSSYEIPPQQSGAPPSQPLHSVFVSSEAPEWDAARRSASGGGYSVGPRRNDSSGVVSSFLRGEMAESKPAEKPMPAATPVGAAPENLSTAAEVAMSSLQAKLDAWKREDAANTTTPTTGAAPSPVVAVQTPFVTPSRPQTVALPTTEDDVKLSPSSEASPIRTTFTPAGFVNSLNADQRVQSHEISSILTNRFPQPEASRLDNPWNNFREDIQRTNRAAMRQLVPEAPRDWTVPEEPKQGPAKADRVDMAAADRMLELERRLSAHQNGHVRQRATLNVSIDKARYEMDRADFRVTELQTNLEGIVYALRERVNSRLNTASQLRKDNEIQISSAVRSQLKSLPKSHAIPAFDTKKSKEIENFKLMMEQYRSHMDVQASLLQQQVIHGVADAREQIRGALHVVNGQIERDTIQSMHSMIEVFAKQTREQLESLRTERINFERHFVDRLSRLRNQVRGAPV